MSHVYLHSPVLSQFGKTNKSYLELSVDVAKKSIQNFDKERIEFLIFSAFAPERYTQEFNLPAKIGDALGLESIFCIRSETASSSGASAIHLAKILLDSGKFKTGLVIGTEVMSRLNREENNILLGSVLSQKQISLSMSMAQGAALITNRYLNDFGYSKNDLFPISKKLHDNGLKNPISHIKKNLSFDEYIQSPVFSSPLCLYDISPLSDGSCSIVVSSEVKSEFSIIGTGHGTGSFQSVDFGYSFTASKDAFRKAYNEGNISPSEVDVAELHDAFTTFELIGAEDAGIFPKGEALKNVIGGVTHPNGKIPINPSGGLKTRGHPVGASGLAQIAEIIEFMKNAPNAEIGLTHSIGGLATNNFATLIKKA
ncbi:MAG: thiolase family protein [Leptospiraceae bacterium]|nr:thiolase family protein [Leptospiraceae bacterium]MCK6379743.1 thiolase family protein [Leptospiraceae bacterium]NUM40425.1 thiolase family protein [Leptospiraceae bacterium]